MYLEGFVDASMVGSEETPEVSGLSSPVGAARSRGGETAGPPWEARVRLSAQHPRDLGVMKVRPGGDRTVRTLTPEAGCSRLGSQS